MVAGCKKYRRIAQTRSPPRFQLDFFSIPLGISLIFLLLHPTSSLAHSQGLFSILPLLLYAEL